MPQAACSDAVTSQLTCPPRLAGEVEPLETVRRDTHRIAILELHPTQMTVGYREVAERRRLRRAAAEAGDGAFQNLIVPVVLGPGDRSYILDRHHELCVRAAEREADSQVVVVDDLRRLEWVGFWRTLDRRGWCRPHAEFMVAVENITSAAGTEHDRYDQIWESTVTCCGSRAPKPAPFRDFAIADGHLRRAKLRNFHQARIPPGRSKGFNCTGEAQWRTHRPRSDCVGID